MLVFRCVVKSLCIDLILLTLAGKFPLSEKLKFSEIEDAKLAGSRVIGLQISGFGASVKQLG